MPRPDCNNSRPRSTGNAISINAILAWRGKGLRSLRLEEGDPRRQLDGHCRPRPAHHGNQGQGTEAEAAIEEWINRARVVLRHTAGLDVTIVEGLQAWAVGR